MNLKESALAYQPKTAKNITELKSVDITLAMQVETGKDSEGEEYSYQYVEVAGEKYRVPDSVLKQLKEIGKIRPNLRNFVVTKTGEGRLTKYQVIPLD
jgi:hypothetical protein